MDNRRKHEIQLPAELADIKRVDSMNILGETVNTPPEHVDRILGNRPNAPSVFALKTIASTRSKPRMPTQRIQRSHLGKTDVYGVT